MSVVSIIYCSSHVICIYILNSRARARVVQIFCWILFSRMLEKNNNNFRAKRVKIQNTFRIRSDGLVTRVVLTFKICIISVFRLTARAAEPGYVKRFSTLDGRVGVFCVYFHSHITRCRSRVPKVLIRITCGICVCAFKSVQITRDHW